MLYFRTWKHSGSRIGFNFLFAWVYLILSIFTQERNEKPALKAESSLLRKESAGQNTLFDLAEEVTVT